MRAHERCCTAASRLWNSVGVTNIVAWQSIDASIWLSSMRSDSTLVRVSVRVSVRVRVMVRVRVRVRAPNPKPNRNQSDSTLSCETTPIAGRMSSYVSSCAARVWRGGWGGLRVGVRVMG